MSEINLYNSGSGLTDIVSTQVQTDYLVCDDINTISGQLKMNNNDLIDVHLINGFNIATVNNRTLQNSNVAYGTSNVVFSGIQVNASNVSILKDNLQGKLFDCSNINANGLVKVFNSNLVDTDKRIDYQKWIKNGPVYNQDDSMAIAGIVLGSLGILSSLGGVLLTQNGMGSRLYDDINDKLGGDSLESDYDPFASDSNLLVHWNAITYPPIYTNKGLTDVGFSSNTYHSSKSKLVKLLYSSYIDTDGGRIRRMNTGPGRTKTIFDFETENLFCETVQTTSNIQSSNVYSSNVYVSREMTACNISASNAIVLSNLQAPYMVGYEIQTNTLSGNQVRVGNIYTTGTGIYINDPANPVTSTQVIDGTTGAYMGLINKEQIRNLEAWNINRVADGLMEWSSFQTTTMPEYFDPFVSATNPLFDV